MLYISIILLTTIAQQPLDIWHDPNALALMGIGAGTLGALATIGATIYTVWQGRTKRRIDYQVISDTPIVTVDSTVAGKVQVLFNGQSAEETRVLVLKISNAGNSSIRKEDYFEPLSFEFDTDVISADVLETEPPTLLSSKDRKSFLTLGTQNVQFPLFPLNRHDTLTMTILLKENSAMRVAGRLDQGTIVNRILSDMRYVATTSILSLSTVALFIISIVLLLIFKSPLMVNVYFPFFAAIFATLTIVNLYRMFKITTLPVI